MHLVLIGYMGSGKSKIGKLLATALDCAYIDLDSEIEAREHKSIPNIFSEKGEIYFRKKEGEALKDILKTESTIVLSTGGGTPCYGGLMDFMKGSEEVLTVYLKTSLDELTRRLYPERHTRPLIAHLETQDDLKDFIRKHLFERSWFYNQSHIIVDTSESTPEQIVENIVVQLF